MGGKIAQLKNNYYHYYYNLKVPHRARVNYFEISAKTPHIFPKFIFTGKYRFDHNNFLAADKTEEGEYWVGRIIPTAGYSSSCTNIQFDD